MEHICDGMLINSNRDWPPPVERVSHGAQFISVDVGVAQLRAWIVYFMFGFSPGILHLFSNLLSGSTSHRCRGWCSVCSWTSKPVRAGFASGGHKVTSSSGVFARSHATLKHFGSLRVGPIINWMSLVAVQPRCALFRAHPRRLTIKLATGVRPDRHTTPLVFHLTVPSSQSLSLSSIIDLRASVASTNNHIMMIITFITPNNDTKEEEEPSFQSVVEHRS